MTRPTPRPHTSGWPPLSRLLGALLTSTVLIVAGMSLTPAAQADDVVPPSVLPALQSWTPANGSLQLTTATRIIVDGDDSAALEVARTFADDLRAERGLPAPVVTSPDQAHAGDIVLTRDTSRSDLGAEGYALKVGDRIEIVGGTAAGVFYGTRTVLQLAATGDKIPAGSTVDVPAYRERAVAVCACYTYNTMAWMDRLIKDMAYLKLNMLHLELKVKSADMPKINTFSYYTPAEVKHIVALAAKYHIEVKPEVNSPGHMDPYISAYPDLQLVDKSGKADPYRLDITKPEAFTFYKKLIDAELPMFPGRYWHMGADEYMDGSAYGNYPQLLAYARQKYGPNAVPQDAYIDFINRVDAYVRSKGRTLRIWNDGLNGSNTVPLNKDIDVEYWESEPVKPQDLLDSGHTVMNASIAMYYVRGGQRPDAKGLYDSGWSPLTFPGQTVAAGQAGVSGAELTVWPNNYGKETENTAQTNMFLPLRVFAQSVWGSPKPTPDYAGFQQLATGLGHAPGWGEPWDQPLDNGSYVLRHNGDTLASPSAAGSPVLAEDGKQTWRLVKTSDGYYTLISDVSGLCADMQRGTPNPLGVVEQAGAAVTGETCSGSETQKWQLEQVSGGFRVVNAITQEAADVENGQVDQQPRDVATEDVWEIAPTTYVAPALSVTPEATTVDPRATSQLDVALDNTSGGPLKNARLTLRAGDGWRLDPATIDLGTIARGATVSRQVTLTAPAHNATTTVTATATYDVGGQTDRVDAIASVVAQSAHSVFSQAYDGPSYKRLTRTISVPAGGGSMKFWTDYATEQGWDYMFVEAHTPGQDDWTTLPDANGHTSTTPGDSCVNDWVSLHPQMAHYQTYSNGKCTSTGTTGSWNAATGSSGGWVPWEVDLSKWAGKDVEVSISYASDWATNDAGVWIDDIALPDGKTSTFEDSSLDGWAVPGAPTGDPANPNDYVVTTTR